MNGTYGFVYSGDRGVGLGVFSIKDSVLIGSDTGGAKYSGSAVQNSATGEVTMSFEMFVPAGTLLIQGTSEQDLNYTKTNLTLTLRRDFDNGEAIKVYIPPGNVNLMIRQIPDDYAVFTKGFDIRPVG
jgi:hypothetical protein